MPSATHFVYSIMLSEGDIWGVVSDRCQYLIVMNHSVSVF